MWIWDPRDLGSSLHSLCNRALDLWQVPSFLSLQAVASEGLVHGLAASVPPC